MSKCRQPQEATRRLALDEKVREHLGRHAAILRETEIHVTAQWPRPCGPRQ